MKKIFSVILLTAIIFFCGQNKIEAADIWLYTDKNGAEYYLREYYLPARAWSFAHVVKISGNNITDLAYRFEILNDVHYSVCEGNTSYVFVSRDPHPIIEKGNISENPFAYKIYNDYLAPLVAERNKKFRENENGRR